MRLLGQIFFCTKPMFSVGRRGATACHIPLAARPHFSVARRRFLGVKTCPFFGFKNAPEKRSPNNILIFVDRFSGTKTCPDSGLKNVPDFWSRAPTFFKNLAKFLGAIHALVRGSAVALELRLGVVSGAKSSPVCSSITLLVIWLTMRANCNFSVESRRELCCITSRFRSCLQVRVHKGCYFELPSGGEAVWTRANGLRSMQVWHIPTWRC